MITSQSTQYWIVFLFLFSDAPTSVRQRAPGDCAAPRVAPGRRSERAHVAPRPMPSTPWRRPMSELELKPTRARQPQRKATRATQVHSDATKPSSSSPPMALPPPQTTSLQHSPRRRPRVRAPPASPSRDRRRAPATRRPRVHRRRLSDRRARRRRATGSRTSK